MKLTTLSVATILALAGCAGLPPSAEKLAAMPIVTYPDKPGTGDFVYKLPAGKPIDLHLQADGSALVNPVNQTISGSLKHDLYLHKNWASEDGRHWVGTRDLIEANISVTLPSYQSPQPGEMHLSVNLKQSD